MDDVGPGRALVLRRHLDGVLAGAKAVPRLARWRRTSLGRAAQKPPSGRPGGWEGGRRLAGLGPSPVPVTRIQRRRDADVEQVHRQHASWTCGLLLGLCARRKHGMLRYDGSGRALCARITTPSADAVEWRLCEPGSGQSSAIRSGGSRPPVLAPRHGLTSNCASMNRAAPA